MSKLATLDLILWIFSPVVFAQIVLVIQGLYKLKTIDSVAGEPATPAEGLSIVVAARNEERGLPPSLESLAKISGNWLEIIVVNDRSKDGTSKVIQEFSALDLRFKLITIETLPEGWLGKNHALQKGSELATHPWILFTDADILHSEVTLKKALHHAQTQKLDFFSLLIDVHSPSTLVSLFVSFFAFSFSSFFRPWLSSDPKSKSAVGVGAFNLVRKSFYQQNAGHGPIANRPDDDVMLARHLKNCGGKLDLMIDIERTSVEWYPSFMEAARGLEKNTLAGLNYSYLLWAASLVACTFCFIVAPLWGLFTFSSIGLIYYFGTTISALIGSKQRRQPLWHALLFPFASLLFVLIVFRAGILTAWRGGIFWRGHFYRLSELRQTSSFKRN